MAEIQVQIELFREVAVKEILHVGGDGFHTPVMQVDACRLAVGIGTDMATCMHDGGGMLEILVLRRPVGLRAISTKDRSSDVYSLWESVSFCKMTRSLPTSVPA